MNAGLLAGGGDLLAHLAGGHQLLGQGDPVVLEEHHLQTVLAQGVLVDVMGQGVDHLDDPLGHGVARGGLGAEEEQVGRHLHVGVVPELLVEMDDVHHVQQLALVLVEALHLHVEDGVGVQDDPLLPLGVLGEGHLVGLLDVL